MKYVTELGETGAGITSADEINMEKPNKFTNKWGKHNKKWHLLVYSHTL
jgi:hypothetical protein